MLPEVRRTFVHDVDAAEVHSARMWRSAMRATQTAWNSLSHLEEATLHPGLYKRLRACSRGLCSYCSDGGGSVGPVPWLSHCRLESRVCQITMLQC